MFRHRWFRKVKNFLLFCIYLIYIKTIRVEFLNNFSNEQSIVMLFHEGSSIFSKVLKQLKQQLKIDFCIMISDHQDGDLMQRVALAFQLNFFRFDTKNNQNLRSYLKKIQLSNNYPVIAVDGPVGPYRNIQPGVLFLQKQLSMPIQCIFLKAHHFFRINTWDRHIFPFPFTKVQIKFGAPFYYQKHHRKGQMKELWEYFNHTEQRIKK